MSKLLGHFLEEQQEPFALEVFLLERGCRRGIKKSPNCSAFLKALFGRNAIKLKGSHQDRCSSSSSSSSSLSSTSTSSTTLLSDGRGVHEGEVGAERKKKDEELSPVSVLHQTQTAESPIHFKVLHKRHSPSEEGEPSNSKPQWKLMKKKHRFVGPSTCDQYSVNMKDLHQKKQLLIDCVREVMEKERHKMLGADEAWKLVCENVLIWSQDSINGSNLLHSEDDEWKWNADFEQSKMEISNEVENAIFEDVINEIVTF